MVSLTNGIRVVSVHLPASTNVSIFTFLPLGLTSDGPDRAQWSHLVEHLVIRSTVPAGSAIANAETLPDHMRLDFYGHTNNWKEGLTHHRQWLAGVPFTSAGLAAEKPKVIAECDYTASNLATHKFAVAAWSQAWRHGAKHVALKGDVTQARLAEVQRFRDERLAVSNRVTVCVVGPEAAESLPEVERQLGALNLRAQLPAPSTNSISSMDLTWDLDARHLLLTWPIPDYRHEDHAGLMVAAQCLNQQLAADPELQHLAGMMFAGCDLATPEGNYFFISASLRPSATFEEIRDRLLSLVSQLSTNTPKSATMIGRQLADSLTQLPDPQAILAQAPPNVSRAMIEGNLGLQLGMREYRYGDQAATLARQLAGASGAGVEGVVREHLSAATAAVCTVSPKGQIVTD
jgi:predicted Zn-dependent peptidase